MTGWRAPLANLAVATLAIVTIAPLLWMVSVSLMPRGLATTYPPPLWPSQPTLANYRELLFAQDSGAGATDFRIVPAFFNSLYLAVIATVTGLALTVPAGYAFAKLRFSGRDSLLRVLLVLVIIPTQVSMLPLFLMLRYAGLVNTYLGVLAPGFAAIYGVLFVRQATLAIPDELFDAARIDGAGEWQVFAHIVWPLLRPVTFTLALFTFLASWSDFLWPLIVITDQARYTLPVALATISREHAQDVELMMAGAVVTTLPVLALFLALQRSYLSGLFSGGIKG